MKRLFVLLLVINICIISNGQTDTSKRISVLVPQSREDNVPSEKEDIKASGEIGTFDYVDVKYGFKDIKLESDINAIKKNVLIKKTESAANLKFYDIRDKKYLKVGSCNLKEVFFTCFKGKVLSIYIKTDATNSRCLLESLNELYGKGFQLNEFMEKYAWVGKRSTVMYSENSIKKDALTAIRSSTYEKVYKDFMGSVRKKDASDF